MQPRTMILAVLLGGPMLGALLGAAANPRMLPPPEPTWRKLQPDVIFTKAQYLADAGPQDLSPAWEIDRSPTWKRRAMEREVALRMYQEEAAGALESIDTPTTEQYDGAGIATAEAATGQTAARDALADAPQASTALRDQAEPSSDPGQDLSAPVSSAPEA